MKRHCGNVAVYAIIIIIIITVIIIIIIIVIAIAIIIIIIIGKWFEPRGISYFLAWSSRWR